MAPEDREKFRSRLRPPASTTIFMVSTTLYLIWFLGNLEFLLLTVYTLTMYFITFL